MPTPRNLTPEQRMAELEHEMKFVPGALCHIKRDFQNYKTTDLMVVTKVNPKRISVVPVGGQYLGLNVPAAGLELVPVAPGERMVVEIKA